MRSTEQVLLIGDDDRGLRAAVEQAWPGASIARADTVFDGIAELAGGSFTTVVAAAEPIQRRPEAAVRVIRQLMPAGRVLLYGRPALEPVARHVIRDGADDFLVEPVQAADLTRAASRPIMRLADPIDAPADAAAAPTLSTEPVELHDLLSLPLAELSLDAQLAHPSDAPKALVSAIAARLPPGASLVWTKPAAAAPVHVGSSVVAPLVVEQTDHGLLHLFINGQHDDVLARHLIESWARLLIKTLALQDRTAALQRLAITDDLTGLYNGRYFRNFLGQILKWAREKYLPVTLLLFDIDGFKKYNDEFGHGVGDEILKETARLIKRACRDHDFVSRISGDEFAVVFWDKEGPREPYDSRTANPARVPQSIVSVLERFRRLVGSAEFSHIGVAGRGRLSISGGLAVYPYDATSPEGLVEAADRELMFKAKKAGKNCVFLVGSDRPVSEQSQ